MKVYSVLYKVVQAGELKNFRGQIWGRSISDASRNALPTHDFVWVANVGDEHGVMVLASTILHIQVSAYVETTIKEQA